MLLAHVVEVYPRACGGTASDTDAVEAPVGLSPRLRGNHSGVGVAHYSVRWIRAYPFRSSHKTRIQTGAGFGEQATVPEAVENSVDFAPVAE